MATAPKQGDAADASKITVKCRNRSITLVRLGAGVIAQPGIRYLIVLEGINDIGLLAREKGARIWRVTGDATGGALIPGLSWSGL